MKRSMKVLLIAFTALILTLPMDISAGSTKPNQAGDAVGFQGNEESLEDDSKGASEASQEIDGEGVSEETEAGEIPSYLLEEFTVTASRYERSVFEASTGINLIDSQKILNTAPFETADALLNEPGIWDLKSGHLYGSPIIRGFVGNQVLTLFDGIRRNTAGLFPGPNWYLNNIDSLSLKRIEVVRGPGSVLYGSDAIGGVINVITLQEPLFSEETQFHGTSILRYSSVDEGLGFRGEISFSSPRLFGIVGGTWKQNDDIEGGRGDGLFKPSYSHNRSGDLQLNWLVEDHHCLGFSVQRFQRAPTRRYDQPTWRQEDDRTLYVLRYSGKSEQDWFSELKATVYFHEQDSFIEEIFWNADSRDDTVGFDAQADFFPMEEWRLTGGVHFHRDEVKNYFPKLSVRDPDVTWKNPAIFLLSDYPLTNRLRMEAGLRWDRTVLDSDPPDASSIPLGLSADDLDLHETNDAVTGGLGLVYSLTDEVNLVGHVGRAFRAPSKHDLLSYGPSFRGFQIPSPGLDPETSWTFETGTRVRSPRLNGELTYFYTKLRNFIDSVTGTFNGYDFMDMNGNGVKDPEEENMDIFIKKNVGKAYIHGLELNGVFYLDAKWSLFGNFTWMYGKNRTDDEPIDRGIPVNGLLGVRWEDYRDPPKKNYWVELSVHMVNSFDRIPDNSLNTDPAYRRNPQDPDSGLLRSDGSIPGYAILNLRGGIKLFECARLVLGIENFGDRKYRSVHSRMNGPGLNLYSSIEVEL